MTRQALGSLIALGLALALVPAAAAGGWAVVTMDELPGEVHAGETLKLGFMVRQHGKTATNDVDPYLEARNTATGDRLVVEAVQQGEIGHFVVEVSFPAAGTWEWSIVPAPFEGTPLEPILVQPAVLTQPATSPDQAAGTELGSLRLLARGLGVGLLLVAAALAVLDRRSSRRTASEQA